MTENSGTVPADWPEDGWPPGTRVRVIKDPDWDGPYPVEFSGTVAGTRVPFPVRDGRGREGELVYVVRFDEPQYDSHGLGPYRGGEVWGRHLVAEDTA
ncbi:ferrous iron transport protein A [Streptomyces sp. NPDC005435]|uniref:ferrous iron transport protein A n=1 Tax=Streptomyces sp. NPDC005435 TaxID=3154464 RepID=UPI0034543790